MAITSPPTVERPATVEDYLALGEGPPYYELYAGELQVNPPPTTDHQDIVGRLYATLLAACPPELNVLVAPVDWIIDRHNVVQPDVLVARRDDIGPNNLTAPPLLAVEVLSRSTRRHDLVHKRVLYERAGLPSYWIVDPGSNSGAVTLTVLERTRDGHLVEVTTATGDTSVLVREPFELAITPSTLRT